MQPACNSSSDSNELQRSRAASIWGPAVCYRNSRENAKVQEEKNHKILVVPLTFHECLAKIGPRTSGVPRWSSWQIMDVPRPLPTHFAPILHFWFFFWKKSFISLKYFLFVHVLFEVFELQVSRKYPAFPIVLVSSRAPETKHWPISSFVFR